MPAPGSARRFTPRRMRRLLNLYPPFVFQRVRVVRIDEGFRGCRVQVRKSFLTRNLQGTTFGGTIFSAADPIYALLLWQALAHRGVRVQAWLRSARIRYRRPAASTLTLDFRLDDALIEEAQRALAAEGRFAREFAVRAVDAEGRVCAEILTEAYVRLRPGDGPDATGF